MENEEYETIDLLEVLNAVRQHLLAVILTTLILACAGFGVSKFLMTPKYQASALMIVNTRQDTTSNVTSDQINSATKLVSTYSIIIKSDTVLQQVINNLGLSLTYSELAGRVAVSAVDDNIIRLARERDGDLTDRFVGRENVLPGKIAKTPVKHARGF